MNIFSPNRRLLYFVFDYKIFSNIYGDKKTLIVSLIEKAIKGGVDILQYRDKINTTKEFFYIAKDIAELSKTYNIPFIINDHVDIALAINANGVHLGQDDFPPAEISKLNPPKNFIIGLSTHNKEEIKEAIQLQNEKKITYFNIGPIFRTSTKEHLNEFIGTDLITYTRKIHPNAIFSVMGGIHSSNVKEVIKAGANIVAVVTELLNEDDIYQNTLNFKKLLR